MDITLPIKGFTVSLYDYVPRSLYEELEELNSGGVKLDRARYESIDVDEVSEELGADRAKEIQDEEDEAKAQILLNDARNEILGKEVRMTFSMADIHEIERVKCAGMVEQITDGKKVLYADDGDPESKGLIRKILSKLPNNDFELISSSILEIWTKINEDEGKSEGQSSTSSSESPSTAPEQKGEQETS
tara:strand:+ start:2646 stop:3212 length:567 start_codon:yes stop_codon:yes gene_type:complete